MYHASVFINFSHHLYSILSNHTILLTYIFSCFFSLPSTYSALMFPQSHIIFFFSFFSFFSFYLRSVFNHHFISSSIYSGLSLTFSSLCEFIYYCLVFIYYCLIPFYLSVFIPCVFNLLSFDLLFCCFLSIIFCFFLAFVLIVFSFYFMFYFIFFYSFVFFSMHFLISYFFLFLFILFSFVFALFFSLFV